MADAIDELVDRFRSGDEDAGAELYRRSSGRLLLLMVKRRPEGSRSRCRAGHDSEAILKDGFRSFFGAVGEPHFDPDKGSMVGLLDLRRLVADGGGPEP